ncbi:MAG TPA: cytochrome c3 family protein [Symbiobacteriaceae bacterium]|nr:cytochrome c3 family protein [Symbiobacteriaceae bacterium]
MKRFKINWAIPGLFGIIFVISAVAWMQSQAAVSPDPAKLATQCAACHTMDSHVQQWEEGSHKDVACTACHADPGVSGWVKMKVGQIQMKFRQEEVDLSQIATEVPNSRCLECHARQMPWVMQDLKPAKLDEKGEPIRPDKSELKYLTAIAGHDVHLTMESPLKCTDCHSIVSHGPAPAKRQDHAQAMHEICLDCHAQRQVTLNVRSSTACSACHINREKVVPNDHLSASFRSGHADSAAKDSSTCTQCHLNTGIISNPGVAPHGIVPKLPPGSIKVPAGTEDACSTCHGITMPHPADFLSKHAQGFQEQPALCASCHGTRDQGFNLTFKGDPRTLSTTNPSCTGCHAQPMPHPENYLNGGHQAAGKAAPQTCEQCHSPANKANPKAAHATSQFCKDCHLGKYNHPQGYVFQHAGVLAEYGNNYAAAGCVQCHSTTQGGQNSCTSCHTNGITSDVWHPADFTITHKETLAQYGNNQGAAGCTQCHGQTPAQNACTTCHTGGITGTQWHAANFVGTHKDTLAQYGNNQVTAGCTQCHGETPARNSCTACHSNGLTSGQPTEWHPTNWWITHARTTTPNDVASCNKCHSYVEPSCSKCHTGF